MSIDYNLYVSNLELVLLAIHVKIISSRCEDFYFKNTGIFLWRNSILVVRPDDCHRNRPFLRSYIGGQIPFLPA